MEKIYMNNNSQNNGISSKYHLSIILSFIVAIFAIISLIAVGFNQISFAAPTDDTVAAGEPGFKLGWYYKTVAMRGDADVQAELRQVGITSYDDNLNADPDAEVEILQAVDSSYAPNVESGSFNSANPVFCFGSHSDLTINQADYTDNGEINDNKVSYILNKSGIYN